LIFQAAANGTPDCRQFADQITGTG